MSVEPNVDITSVPNYLPLDIDVFGFNPVAADNKAVFMGSVKPDRIGKFPITEPYVRVTLAASGAIVREVARLGLTEVLVDPLTLTGPFNIPSPPVPGNDQPIPPDSVPWLVGIGSWSVTAGDATGVVFTREQYWHKSPESFSLPPNSYVQKTLQQTSGRTKTSSTAEDMRSLLGLTAGAGWGPFSATASVSLSTMSQRTDTVTIREEASSSIDQFFSNQSSQPVVVCFWQLIERIRLLKGEKCVAAVDAGVLPLIPMSFSPSDASG
ncbi:MAG: hypothetical protein ACOZAM_09100 [Pseudomonadota bacterium]